MTDQYKVGQIIELNDGRTATVSFAGTTQFAPGDWVGVVFDEPSGKNDGSVQGQRYFECDPGHGMFLRPGGVGKILEQPKAKAKPPTAAGSARPGVPAAAPKSRPSSMANGVRWQGSQDPAALRRQSINSASPSPGARLMNGKSVGFEECEIIEQRIDIVSQSPTKQGVRSTTSSLSNNAGAPPIRGQTAATSTASRLHGKPTTTSSRPSLSSTASRASTQSSVTSRSTRPSLGASSATSRTKTTPATSASRNTPTQPSTRSTRPNLAPTSRAANGAARPPRQESNEKLDRIPDSEDMEPPNEDGAEEDPKESSEREDQPFEKINGHAEPPAARPSPKPPSQPTQRSANTARQIEDLETRLRMTEKKRDEDKERLKTLEHLKTEKDRFEGIIQKLQAKLHPQQQELVELRKTVKEQETKVQEAERTLADHETDVEMATVDREMAEEQAEAARIELDACKSTLEEMKLEVEVLREENQEFGREVSSEERSSLGWIHLERENERYRDAIVRLRDMTQDTEAELKDQIASLQQDLKDLSGVQEQFQETKERLSQSQAAVEDLKQQLDTALGAEDMLEEMTEKNLTLTEQIDELKLTIEDLESLKELNDELELNHVEAEKQMQEELDFKDSILGDQRQHAAQQDERLADYEYTTNKFRELVANLQSHLEDMKASQQINEVEAEDLNSRSKAMADLNLKLQSSAAKSQANSVDMELRRLEAQEAVEHLSIVQMFLPDSFRSERDSVLAYLRFRRISAKSKVLHQALRAKISGEAAANPPEDVFAICDILEKLVWISAMCDRFISSINACSLEKFPRYEGALYDLEPVERGLNGYLELLKKGEMKERTVSEELSRSKALLTHLSEAHLTSDSLDEYAEDVLMRTMLTQSYLENTATALSFTKAMLPLPEDSNGNAESSDTAAPSNDFANEAEILISQTRSAKVVAGKAVTSITELKARSMSLTKETSSTSDECDNLSSSLATLTLQLGTHLRRTIDQSESAETPEDADTDGYPDTPIRTLLRTSLSDFCKSHIPDTTSSTPFPILRTHLRHITERLSRILDLCADLTNTLEFERGPPPWELRAAELKHAKLTSISTEEELKRLKDDIHERATQLRLRDQTLEEQAVKIELLEARTKDANLKANRITELQRFVDEGRRREKDLMDAMTAQTVDVQNLKGERDRWKRVADERQPVAASDDDSYSGSGGENETTDDAGAGHAARRQKRKNRKALGDRAVATAREMEALRLEVTGLQASVKFLYSDNRRVRLARPDEAQMNWLKEPVVLSSRERWELHAKNTFAAPRSTAARNDAGPAGDKEDAIPTAADRRTKANAHLTRLLDIALSTPFPADLSVLSATAPENRLKWRPAKQKSEWKCARAREQWEAWKGEVAEIVAGPGVLRKSADGVRGEGRHRRWHGGAGGSMDLRIPGAFR
ncbi:MAG: hypothetical protein M1831_001413 [Alyxoria varia]|nr:MAG: hypothetical protein M1831_001413 [Alyxoria varia]